MSFQPEDAMEYEGPKECSAHFVPVENSGIGRRPAHRRAVDAKDTSDRSDASVPRCGHHPSKIMLGGSGQGGGIHGAVYGALTHFGQTLIGESPMVPYNPAPSATGLRSDGENGLEPGVVALAVLV